MQNVDYDDVIYFRSINSFNQKVFPVPIPLMSRMSPKQLLLMGLGSLIAYAAYTIPAWHLVPISIFFVYIAAKERKALYPERHVLAILRFLIRRYITKAPVNSIERSQRAEMRAQAKNRNSKHNTGLFVFPKTFSPKHSALGSGSIQSQPRRVYAAKLGTPLSLEVTMYDAAGKLYPRTRADVVFDGQHYTVVSDSNGQFEIYPIVSAFGQKDLTVSVEDRKILSESFDIHKG